MSVFEDKQKIGLISSELKNRHNVKAKCVCFSTIISGLKQEEKYMVYEDNYYRLQEYKNLEKELGIDLEKFLKALENGFYRYRPTARNNVIYFIAKPKVNMKQKCFTYGSYGKSYFKDYGKTWALDEKELTKEELEK